MKTENIGRAGNNFEDQLWAITRPDGQYYMPDADATMDCALLKSRIDSIDISMNYWLTKLSEDLNDEERKYAREIVNVYRAKREGYVNISLRNCSTIEQTVAPVIPPTTPDYTDTEVPETPTTGESKTNWPLILAIVAGGMYFINKSKQKKVKGIPSNDAVLLSGGTYLLMWFAQNRSQVPTPTPTVPITQTQTVPITQTQSVPVADNQFVPVSVLPAVPEWGPIPEPRQYTDPTSDIYAPGTFKGEDEMKLPREYYSSLL